MGKKIQSLGDYTLKGVTLGKGRIARVELAAHKDIKVKVALKVVDTAKLAEQALLGNEYTKEARVLTQLRHPNIVRLYETLRAKTYYTMVLEFIPGGSLRAHIKTFPDCRLPENIWRTYLRQLISALHYLHERNVVHRNLNMENVLLDANHKNAKIIDFTVSDIITPEQAPSALCGSLDFVAPEMMSGSRYGFEVDVWSLGIIMYNCLVGEVPFITMPGSLANKKNRAIIANRRLSTNHHARMAHLSESCQCLISKMLENSPTERITMADIQVHAWFTQDGKKPFVPYQCMRYDSSIRKSVIGVLAKEYGVDVQHLDLCVTEKKNNRVTTMYYLLLDEAKREKGIYEQDHTVAPALSSPTSSSNLQNSHMCTSQCNAVNEPSKFNCTLECFNFERSVSVCVDSQSPSSPSQSSLVRPRWDSMRHSLQQGSKLLDEFLEQQRTDGKPETARQVSAVEQSQSAQDQSHSVSRNSLWRLSRNSPALSPDVQRKSNSNTMQRTAPDELETKVDGDKLETELRTFREREQTKTNTNHSAEARRLIVSDTGSALRTSKTSFFDRTLRQNSAGIPGTTSFNLLIAPKAAMDDIDETLLGYTAAAASHAIAEAMTPTPNPTPTQNGSQSQQVKSNNHVGDVDADVEVAHYRCTADSTAETNQSTVREVNGHHHVSELQNSTSAASQPVHFEN